MVAKKKTHKKKQSVKKGAFKTGRISAVEGGLRFGGI